MITFTDEEINLICIYDPGNRKGTIYELRDMMGFLTPEETDLKTLAEGVIAKLERMTDKEYDEFSDGLTLEYSFDGDDDSAYGMLSEAFSEDDNDLDDDSE